MNIKRLKRLAEELRNTDFHIIPDGDYHKIFYKKVILASVPEAGLAEKIAREYGALNARLAEQIETMVDHIEANAKQQLLNLNFGGSDVDERPVNVTAG